MYFTFFVSVQSVPSSISQVIQLILRKSIEIQNDTTELVKSQKILVEYIQLTQTQQVLTDAFPLPLDNDAALQSLNQFLQLDVDGRRKLVFSLLYLIHYFYFALSDCFLHFRSQTSLLILEATPLKSACTTSSKRSSRITSARPSLGRAGMAKLQCGTRYCLPLYMVRNYCTVILFTGISLLICFYF